MSSYSEPLSDFDLWDLVCCSRCLLPFTSKAGPIVPFWLTECGHVLCNNHLSPDHTCSQCSAQGIQIIPLQKEMEAPMSDWFRSIPLSLDSLAYSVKFQQEMMAAQIMSLRSQCQQQRVIINRLKAENLELKKINEGSRNVTSGIRFHKGLGEHGAQIPLDVVNSNGKRRWNDPHQLEPISQSTTTLNSVYADLAASETFAFSREQKLGRQLPQNEDKHYAEPQQDVYGSLRGTATTDHLSKLYSYRAPQTLHYQPPPLSRTQAAPLTYQQQSQHPPNPSLPTMSSLDGARQNFVGLGRPTPRPRPTKISHDIEKQATDPSNLSKIQRASDQGVKRMRIMGPPPTPTRLQTNGIDHNATNRFPLSSNKYGSSMPTSNTRRFLPPPTPVNKSQHPINRDVHTDSAGRVR